MIVSWFSCSSETRCSGCHKVWTSAAEFTLFLLISLILVGFSSYSVSPLTICISGSDLGRALLKSGVGHPLGKRGLMWLKVHLANLYGTKSKSVCYWLLINYSQYSLFRAAIKDRIAFTDEMVDEIFDSADKPLTVRCYYCSGFDIFIQSSQGNGWWKKSDEPWQTLACCMEITAALRSPNPTEYISHTYVHQVSEDIDNLF